LEFSPEWGWGSSSTLISNLAQWLNLNPWQLLDNTLGGSGYDIACAAAKGPIFYQRETRENPVISPVNFNPAFEEQLWVIFLNQKQDTNQAIRHHQKETSKLQEWIRKTSQISREFVRTTDPAEFMKLMDEHESIISRYTGLPRVQTEKFPDFPGQIKSLGAWGGDFILALSELQDDETRKYFQTKGYNTLFKLSEIKHKHDEER
jgi:mevalonate kinase